MTFEIANFKEIGGPGNAGGGGQMYSVFSTTDALSIMLADSYLDEIEDKLNSRDLVILSGIDASTLVQVTKTGTVITSNGVLAEGPGQAITDTGAIDIVTPFTDITTTGAAAMSLVDGSVGQIKTITLIVDGGTATITPDNALNFTTITMADAGDSVQLQFKALGWAVIGQGGLAGGPVVA